MPRANRGPVAEGTYHVWRRTAGPIPMFRDDTDRRSFCRRLVKAIERYAWVCHSFILMPTHFHLLLSVAADTLQPGMRDAFGPYAQEFNRRWGRSGHLRAGPYGLRWIADEQDVFGVVRYIARNPVRAGLCEAPQEWAWGSYRGSAGYDEQFAFVDDRLIVGALGGDRVHGVAYLRALVETSSRGGYPRL